MSLREMKEEDLEMVLEWRNAPEVRKNMYTSHVISLQEHHAWFERNQNDSTTRYYIYLNNSKPLGVVYFTQYNTYSRSAFWGFYAGSNAPRGTGLWMEYEALNHAFTDLALHKLNCEVLIFNERVIKMHIKVGFIKEGVFRDYHFDGNQYHDVVRLGLLDSEWAVCGPALALKLGRCTS